MMNRTRWHVLTLLICALGLVSLLAGRMPAEGTGGELPPAPALGHPAPEFTLAGPGGETVTLSDLRGQPVILNFWATWCGPCRAEMPELQRVHERLGPAGLVVLGVNQAEVKDAIEDYKEELGLDFPTVIDPRLGVSREYAVNSIPTTFFVDREGIIRNIFIGPMSDAVLADNLRSIYP